MDLQLHTIRDLPSAVLGAGMQIDLFHEFDATPSRTPWLIPLMTAYIASPTACIASLWLIPFERTVHDLTTMKESVGSPDVLVIPRTTSPGPTPMFLPHALRPVVVRLELHS